MPGVHLWNPGEPSVTAEALVVKAEDREYLGLAAAEGALTLPEKIAVVAPNGSQLVELVTVYFALRHVGTDVEITGISEEVNVVWRRVRPIATVLGPGRTWYDIQWKVLIEWLERVPGSRVAELVQALENVRELVLDTFFFGPGLAEVGNGRAGADFGAEVHMVEQRLNGLKESIQNFNIDGGRGLRDAPDVALGRMASSLTTLREASTRGRLVFLSGLAAAHSEVALRTNYCQAAFLHVHRSLDFLFQAVVLDEGVAESNKLGLQYRLGRYKGEGVSLGKSLRALKEGQSVVGIKGELSQVSKVNSDRNEVFPVHGVCGVSRTTTMERMGLPQELAKKLLGDGYGAWKGIRDAFGNDFEISVDALFDAIPDFESYVSIE